MNPVVTRVGEELAGHWWSLLALPGVLFTAVVGATALLEGGDPADPAQVKEALERAAPVLGEDEATLATAVVWLAVVLLAGAVTGLAAHALGAVVLRMWLGRAPFGWVIRWNTGLRVARWRRWREEARSTDRERRVRALERLYRIAPALPSRPTWMADRIAGTGTRIYRVYGLDLVTSWPRLESLLPGPLHDAVRRSRAAFDRAGVLGGWSLLYLAAAAVALRLSWLWWPLVVIAAITWMAAWAQGRSAVQALAVQMEACYDLHACDLARAVGFDPRSVSPCREDTSVRWWTRRAPDRAGTKDEGPHPLPREVGLRVTHHLRKDPSLQRG